MEGLDKGGGCVVQCGSCRNYLFCLGMDVELHQLPICGFLYKNGFHKFLFKVTSIIIMLCKR